MMPPQHVIESMMKFCHCCQCCQNPPCDGVMAAGPCDNQPCVHDDADGDDWSEADDDEQSEREGRTR